MKDGYRYKDGKIIVSDYNVINGNVRTEMEREYQDNIDKILIAENIIEYFEPLKNEVKEKLTELKNKKFSLEASILIGIIPTLFIGICVSGVIRGLLRFCLHLCGILELVKLSSITKLAVLIGVGGTSIRYLKNGVKPTKEEIKELSKKISVSEFTLKEINEELDKQNELLEKLNNDKSKDNEHSLAYDSEYKWVTDYIRLDYVKEISKIESNLWESVAEVEEKIENYQEEQKESRLVKKLTLSKNTRNKQHLGEPKPILLTANQ